MAATSSTRRVSTRSRIPSAVKPANTQTRGASGRRTIDAAVVERPEPPQLAEIEDRVEVVIISPSRGNAATRSRKAKETQYRLGVGRPALAGGSGARAITKSRSVTKSTRIRSKRAIQPVEETIPEGANPLQVT